MKEKMTKLMKISDEKDRQQKFLKHSQKFREMLKKSGKSFEEFLKEARKIREEIADEWFPD